MASISPVVRRDGRAGAGIRSLTIISALIAGIVLPPAHARAQDQSQIDAGLEIWKSSGCPDCHGAFADGDKQRDEAPTGANLRTAKLDTAALKLTISCGRPGGAGMPAFAEGAYKTRPCYDRPLGPPPDDLYPTPRELTPAQIDAVVAYLQARIIGRGRITRTECLAYYDNDEDQCENYK